MFSGWRSIFYHGSPWLHGPPFLSGGSLQSLTKTGGEHLIIRCGALCCCPRPLLCGHVPNPQYGCFRVHPSFRVDISHFLSCGVRKSLAPFSDHATLFKQDLLFSNLAALINYSATFAVTFLLALYLQIVRRSPATAGSILLIQPFVQMIIAPVAGRLSDRTDTSNWQRSVSLPLLSGFSAWLSSGWIRRFHGSSSSLSCSVAAWALFSTPNTTVVMGSVEKSQYGIASSFLATM